MSADLLNQFKPTSEDLLSLVFSQVDTSMLRKIAEADYGEDVDAHFKAFSRQIQTPHGSIGSTTPITPENQACAAPQES